MSGTLYCAHPTTSECETREWDDAEEYKVNYWKSCHVCGTRWDIREAVPKVTLGILD